MEPVPKCTSALAGRTWLLSAFSTNSCLPETPHLMQVLLQAEPRLQEGMTVAHLLLQLLTIWDCVTQRRGADWQRTQVRHSQHATLKTSALACRFSLRWPCALLVGVLCVSSPLCLAAAFSWRCVAA